MDPLHPAALEESLPPSRWVMEPSNVDVNLIEELFTALTPQPAVASSSRVAESGKETGAHVAWMHHPPSMQTA